MEEEDNDKEEEEQEDDDEQTCTDTDTENNDDHDTLHNARKRQEQQRQERMLQALPRSHPMPGQVPVQIVPKKEIATTIFVSVKTVNRHTENLMNKLGIHDRVELTRFAIREGLAEA